MVNIRKLAKDLSPKKNAYSLLNNFRKIKFPGSDGLTAEFYLCFWDYVVIPLKDCLNDTYQRGEKSILQRRGVISLLPKKNGQACVKKFATHFLVEHRLQNCHEMYCKPAGESLAYVDRQTSNRISDVIELYAEKKIARHATLYQF